MVESVKEYSKNRPETVKAYYLKNRLKIIERSKKWMREHPEQCKEYSKSYYRRNREKRKAYTNLHRVREGLIARTYRRLADRSIARGVPFTLTRKEFYDWYAAQPDYCTYCEVSSDSLLNEKRVKHLTVDRKDNDGFYTIDNMCMSCWLCNRLKSDFFTHSEFIEIAKKYIVPKRLGRIEIVKVA